MWLGYIAGNVSYTVTLPPPCRTGEPFACPRLANGMWSLEDLVTIAVLLRDVAREVGSHPVWREK